MPSPLMLRSVLVSRGSAQQVVWVPESFAVVGKVLGFREVRDNGCFQTEGPWNDGWRVEVVYDDAQACNTLDRQELVAAAWRDVKCGVSVMSTDFGDDDR